MSSDSEGSSNFAYSPRKRRKVAPDSDDESPAPVRPQRKRAQRQRTKPAEVSDEEREPTPKVKKPVKPKHRVLIVDNAAEKEPDVSAFLGSDSAPPSSNPWSLRGAIWNAAPPEPPKRPQPEPPSPKPKGRLSERSNGPPEQPPAPVVAANPVAAPRVLSPPTVPSPRMGPVPTARPQGPAEFKKPAVPVTARPPPAPVAAPTPAPATKAPEVFLCIEDFTDADISDYGSDGLDDELATTGATSPDVITPSCPSASSNHPPERPSNSIPDRTVQPKDKPGGRHEDTSRTAQDDVDALADLPSDAFSDPEFSGPESSPVCVVSANGPRTTAQQQPRNTSVQGLRQMTLFGKQAITDNQLGQARMPSPPRDEKPTHHKLNEAELQTWVYPMNLGTIRDYQYNIVERGLFNNLLVALPTGLGKTFIAATIMLNWYRWTGSAQIIFVAPTKPLVSQQVEACLKVAGIPRAQATMLTGGISPGIRAELWNEKRVFFMTPQTLVNDLKTGICDPKRVVLLVVDEAHRATGNFAYVEIVKFLCRFNPGFRVLALTATPGKNVEEVQNVINGLKIARIEIRTEFSLDIRSYLHTKNTDRKIFDNTEEMNMVMELFSSAVQPQLSKLCQFNAFWNRDPMAMTAYGLTQARQRWAASDAGRNSSMGVKGMVQRLFSVLASLAHSVDLLKYHGIGPFYHGMVRFRDGQTTAKGGKYEREILDSEPFQKMMTRLGHWMRNDNFVGHPKLEFLQSSILEHLTNASDEAARNGTGHNDTRVMVFAHFRDSAEEIVRVLRRNAPIIRPHVFVGQAASKDSEGMDQKRQTEIISEFKSGKYNTLVATSIGEEGLDIGEIDLIICYDSSASPIRMLQRMGRTGRKRAGKILLLLMRGKEENSFVQAKDSYEKMQHLIAEGTQFDFHGDVSRRIVPAGCKPVPDKRVIEIPPENSQTDIEGRSSKKGGRAPKRPPKKFNLPDDVETGFTNAAQVLNPKKCSRQQPKSLAIAVESPAITPAEIPAVEDVVLSAAQERTFRRQYLHVGAACTDIAVELPDMTAQPASQRRLGVSCLVPHGRLTRDTVRSLARVQTLDMPDIDRWDEIRPRGAAELRRVCGVDRAVREERSPERSQERSLEPRANTGPQRRNAGQDDDGDEDGEESDDAFSDLMESAVRAADANRKRVHTATTTVTAPTRKSVPPAQKARLKAAGKKAPVERMVISDDDSDEESLSDLDDLLLVR